jgi:hypothetical protein
LVEEFKDLIISSRSVFSPCRDRFFQPLDHASTRGGRFPFTLGNYRCPGGSNSLLTRVELARRWKVSIETLKRRERAKILRPVRLDERLIRYRMSDIVRIEKDGYDGGEG